MMPAPRRLAFSNIPAASGGVPMPGAAADVVAVVGRWYLWSPLVPIMASLANGAPRPATECLAWPLVVPFDGTWDRVEAVKNQTDVTDGDRLAMYRGDPANGNRPETGGGGLLAEVVIGPPLNSGVPERCARVINIAEPGGTVVWCFYGIDNTLGAGTNNVYAVQTAGPAAVYGFGSALTWDDFGMGIGCRRSAAGFKAAGAVYGVNPPDPFAAGWTDRQPNQEPPMLKFRLAAL